MSDVTQIGNPDSSLTPTIDAAIPLNEIQLPDRLFIGIFPGGIVYADSLQEQDGDYKRVAFLPYDSLELQLAEDCPAILRDKIIRDAARIQALCGEDFRISSCNQTVRLGRRK